MKSSASLFSGFDGAGIGAREAGLELVWGIELMPEIAEVGNANLGNHIRVADILNENPMNYERVDHLHMSPPCIRASAANNTAEVNEDGLKESPLDIALAEKCIEFIQVLQPEVVTLENVWGYRLFQSWKGGKKCEGIQSALYRLGYWVSVEHVNSADMGVPQTRKRMIVRAARGGWVPYLPAPVPWVGWYAAIEDILHKLPDSQFAPWQLARLPEELRSVLIDSKNVGQEFGKMHRLDDEPAFTVTTDGKPSHMPRALLVAQGGYGDNVVTVTDRDPSFAITANGNQTKIKALLVSNAKTEYSDGTRCCDDPAFTVTGESNGRVKAFLVNGDNATRDCSNRAISEPTFTVTDGRKHPLRAYDGVGRVVAMTPRALARFQSFPDWYQLPESKTLAAKGIGNAVPPLLMRVIMEGLKGR